MQCLRCGAPIEWGARRVRRHPTLTDHIRKTPGPQVYLNPDSSVHDCREIRDIRVLECTCGFIVTDSDRRRLLPSGRPHNPHPTFPAYGWSERDIKRVDRWYAEEEKRASAPAARRPDHEAQVAFLEREARRDTPEPTAVEAAKTPEPVVDTTPAPSAAPRPPAAATARVTQPPKQAQWRDIE